MKNKKIISFIILFVVVAAAGFFWTKRSLTIPGSGQNKGQATGSPSSSPTSKPAPNYIKTLGDFLVTDNTVCLKDGKPVVYFFGSTSCPHCVWEKPVMEKVAQKFGTEIDFHENIDSAADTDVFDKYSDINPGYVPFLILGCKYARVGAGETLGKDDAESKKLEEEALTAIICKLTNGKPSSTCASLKDKIAEVK